MDVILPIFILGFVAICVANFYRSILHPSVFICSITFVVLSAPVLFASEFYSSTMAVSFVIACIFFFVLGGFVSTYLEERKRFGRVFQESLVGVVGLKISSRTIEWILVGATFAAVLAALYVLQGRGLGALQISSVEALADMSSTIAQERYADETAAPLISRIFLMIGYCGASIGGFVYKALKRRKWLAFFPILGVLMLSIVTTARAPVIYAGILWWSSYLACEVFQGKRRVRLDARKILMGGLGVFLLIAFFVILQALRGGRVEYEIMISQLDRMRIWFFGYLGGFSVWFDSSYFSGISPAMGLYTFAGIFDLLGLGDRRLGIFDEFISIGDGYSTNIYTAYRSLIVDFGLLGTLSIFGVLGYLMNSVYMKVLRGRVKWSVLLNAFYCCVLWAHVTSFLAYNLLIFTFLVNFLFLSFVDRRQNDASYSDLRKL